MSPDAIALRHGSSVERLSYPGGHLLYWRGGDATPLLLLHGAACGAWVWSDGFATRLTRGRDTAALDLPRSDGASLAGYQATVRAALAALDRPALLVGHSLGALLAQRLLDDPRVLGAALLAPVPPEGLWPSNARLALTDFGLWNLAARMTDEVGTAPDGLARGLFGRAMPEAEARRHLHRLGGESRTALMEAQLPQPVPPAFLVAKPVLILGGADDRLIGPDAVARCAAWHGTLPEMLPGRGHLLMLDQGWEEVADRVLDWAERTDRRAARR